MRKIVLGFVIWVTFLYFPPMRGMEQDVIIDFPKVPMRELVRFVSRLTQVNFIGDESLLDFNVSFYSGSASTPEELVNLLVEVLKSHNLEARKQGDYYIIQKAIEAESDERAFPKLSTPFNKDGKFHLYKLQYHPGSEIVSAIKKMSSDLISTRAGDESMVATISSLQWIEASNSLFYSGHPQCIEEVTRLIEQLDTPIKQVFIEVLVIETTMTNSLDFGVEWATNSRIKDSVGGGAGAFQPGNGDGSFAKTMQSIDGSHPPTGLNQVPLSRGFDLSIIGNTIFHKGRSFFSLGALLTMLQGNSDYSIVLNQKILAQENKPSTIFVGDNLPFAGSVVQTIGSSQQTTSNIEYRDVGVTLNITPLIGQSNIVTLKISEEITEAMDQMMHKGQQIQGIKTSKTNMATNAHIPDSHFLILSGMTRNVNGQTKSGPPCLGGIPLLGSLFSKKTKHKEKSSILIFVKPTIIESSAEYIALSSKHNSEVAQ